MDKEDFDANLKITDFGLSRKVEMKMTLGIGAALYSAPELLLKSKYDYLVDMWSLGMVLFEMVSGVSLYDEFDSLIKLIEQQRNT